MPTVLITGANRGQAYSHHQSSRFADLLLRIGAEFVKSFVAKGYTVIAAARNPSSIPAGKEVVPIKYDASSLTSAKEVRDEYSATCDPRRPVV